MRLSKLKIDGLLVFYILSLGLLGISWRYDLIELNERSVLADKVALDLDHSFEQETDHDFFVLDPANNLYVSVNGGKKWRNVGKDYRALTVCSKDITNIPTSIRWQPPLTSTPKVKSFRYLVQNDVKKVRSDYAVYTNVSLIDTKLPIVHLNIHEDDLFDELKGILVQGAESWNNKDFQEAWWYRDANYTQRGADWEKEVIFQYFEDGVEQHYQKCGIRISGNATRGFPQKSFRINARQHYGEDKFDFAFFGAEGNKKYESLVLRMSGNDNTRTMFADLLMHELARDAEVLTQKGKPVLMFINGNYWGIYNLRERIDDYYVSKYSDCKKSEVTILEDGAGNLKDGNQKEQDAFLKLIEEVKQMTNVGESELRKIASVIDVDSYMDYIFFETYFGNNDWPDNNAMAYKIKGEKWKWILNDLDYSLAYPGTENLNFNVFEKIRSSSSVHVVFFNRLITNKGFKNNFVNRCRKNMSSHLSETRIKGIFNKLKKKYKHEIELQIGRWRNINSVADWERNCQNNLDFLIERKVVYEQQLQTL